MNKKKMISLFLIISLCVMLFIPTFSFGRADLQLGDLNSYRGEEITQTQLTERIGPIFSIVWTVGVVLSVVVLIIIGIKYMLGSVEQKAEYKKTLVPYLVGALIVFTGSLIPQLIYLFMQNMEGI